jgi:predicted  nucleic acid-binding Zn-ribbon protein
MQENSQNMTKSLKEKLKDCSKQLQEYEAERSAVIKVLEDSGVDTTGLLLDTSITDEESVLYQDLAEAVVKLREKFMISNNSKTTEKMAEKVSTLQEAVAVAQKEVDESKALRTALEKRLEATKAAARGSREEYASMSAEVQGLRSQVDQLTTDLSLSERKNTGSVDAVSSEVQALEEENIELMKENMDLRKEMSVYRLEVEKVKAQLIKSGGYDVKTKTIVPAKPVNDENQNSNIMSTEKPIEDKLSGMNIYKHICKCRFNFL